MRCARRPTPHCACNRQRMSGLPAWRRSHAPTSQLPIQRRSHVIADYTDLEDTLRVFDLAKVPRVVDAVVSEIAWEARMLLLLLHDPRRLTVARIGNSRGVRIPATTLTRYRIGDAVIMEEREDGILLRPVRRRSANSPSRTRRRAMAAEAEDWSDLESWRLGDGMEHCRGIAAPSVAPVRRAAESSPAYGANRRKRPKSFTESLPAKQTARRQTREEMKRYEVRWANLDPTTGAEMAKTRPVVIVSLDALNDRLQTVTVCPMTSQLSSDMENASGRACRPKVRRSGRRSDPHDQHSATRRATRRAHGRRRRRTPTLDRRNVRSLVRQAVQCASSGRPRTYAPLTWQTSPGEPRANDGVEQGSSDRAFSQIARHPLPESGPQPRSRPGPSLNTFDAKTQTWSQCGWIRAVARWSSAAPAMIVACNLLALIQQVAWIRRHSRIVTRGRSPAAIAFGNRARRPSTVQRSKQSPPAFAQSPLCGTGCSWTIAVCNCCCPDPPR